MMDFWNFAKYTIKGPQSLGNKNQNNISARSRGIHPSYLGVVDVSVVGSDPGVNSIITPFCETNGLYFNENNEPESFRDVFEDDLFKYRKEHESGIFIDYDGDDNSNEVKEFANSLLEKCSLTKKRNEYTGGVSYVKYILPDENDEEVREI